MMTRRSGGGVHCQRRGRASRYNGGVLEMAAALGKWASDGVGGSSSGRWRGSPWFRAWLIRRGIGVGDGGCIANIEGGGQL
ncbi:hypothetical protein E2562_034126 [Oryza meyeriana var. granulata]|uniref:Uncharacterized protein n=1 Tax=Oryza meyeriana var. granulata TaxID=110450 RepID=A0A6G1E6D1_9ORYZ|nr:hypothetical protein E2562_034126 [Oryza meyeriana var. granulata]